MLSAKDEMTSQSIEKTHGNHGKYRNASSYKKKQKKEKEEEWTKGARNATMRRPGPALPTNSKPFLRFDRHAFPFIQHRPLPSFIQ